MPTAVPNVRMVLLKGVDAKGFVFYSNADSIKGGELAANPHAALNFHWKSLRRAVRVKGAHRPGQRCRSRRLFRHPPQGQPDRRLGLAQSQPMEGRWVFEKRHRGICR